MIDTLIQLQYDVEQLRKETAALKQRVSYLMLELSDVRIKLDDRDKALDLLAFEQLEYEDAKLQRKTES